MLELEVRRFRESEWHGAGSDSNFDWSCPGVGVTFLAILLIVKSESESHGAGSDSLFDWSCPGVKVSFLRIRLTSMPYVGRGEAGEAARPDVFAYKLNW